MRCQATVTCPKIFEDYGGPEMWYARAGAGIAGTDPATASSEIPLPDNVRRYYYTSTTHGGGAGGWNLTTAPQPGLVLPANPNPHFETRRALFVNLVAWVTKGIDPPSSAYPKLSDGTLVLPTSAAMGWPNIPGYPTPDNVVNPLFDYDWGSGFRYNDQAGIATNVVPPIKQAIVPLVAKVDLDGNEIAGIRSLLLRMPLGTYTSWNPVSIGPEKGNEGNLAAGYIPFSKTKAERIAAGDPRLSIEERYTTVGNYYFALSVIAKEMIAQRFLLPDDAARITTQALQQITVSGLLPLRYCDYKVACLVQNPSGTSNSIMLLRQ